MKMADVFDIDSSGYHGQQKRDDFNHRNTGGWVPVETNSVSRKDPRLNRRDDGRKHYSPGESPLRSPQRMSKTSTQMYNQMPPAQQYQQQAPPPPPMYSEYNSGYGTATTSYTHSYQQSYQQAQNNSSFGQYNQQSSYPAQNQGYNSGQHQQPGPPGDEYPNSWAPVPLAYPNMSHPPPPPVPRPSSVASTAHTSDSKTDDLKKEAGIAQEMKQQRATLIKQRDEYLRKASVLRRELEKLRMQKHELLADKSPPRDSQRILRENAKLQLEIQNKLKSINNVVDMLSGIIGDGLKAGDEDVKTNSNDSSPKRSRKHAEGSESEEADARSGKSRERERERSNDDEWPHYNYIHYDPELHWCRVCDVFPRSAKDFLNHLHSAEHRQVTQEHQLVDTPWHKLPTDPELPSYKGAPVKRVPIKGLQFFISATSWYCKLCDVWIGDLHCASLHLKSKNHSHNYSNFVEQNPHWETNWLKDREKAVARTKGEAGLVPPAPEPPVIKEKLNKKQLKSKDSSFLESSKEKKRRKKSKKRKKNSSDSSSSSSSSDSSTEDESDKAKSIRVAMRNKMRMQAQMILNEEIGGKLEALRGLVEEKRNRETVDEPPPQQESVIEDNIINQWMTVTTNNDKHILDNLKGRLKQRQEADKEKSIEAAAEQRRREREREERELKEMREREQRELEEKMREEREREERDREERERIKERERNRRKRRSDSRSPERERYGRGRSHSRGRSRSRSIGRRHYGRGRSPERFFRDERRDNRDRRRSPEDTFKPRKPTYDEDEYDKHEDYKGKGKRLVSTLSSSRKLPFIGRMPLFKKRSDGEEKEIKKEDYEIRLSKFEPGNTARAFIPEPGVVHITKLATPQELIPYQSKINAENPPPPPKIIPEPPQISETAPPPPMINDVVTIVEETAMEVQDMELDEAAPPLPPGVPVAEAKPLAKPAGNHLPRDFQDALNIIFPGDQPHTADPNLMMQYQYQMGYSMMYPGMQMYDYSAATEETAVVTEAEETKEATAEPEQIEEKTEIAQPGVDDKEDLAMLGIDAEDMAAQTF